MLKRFLTAAAVSALLASPALAEDDVSESPVRPNPIMEKSAPEKPAAKPEIRKIESTSKKKVKKPTKAEAKRKTAKAPEKPTKKPRPIKVAVAKPATTSAVGADAMIYHDAESKLCIGGVNCPTYCSEAERDCSAKMSYVVQLDRPSYISTIQLNAHDNIGASRRSKLVLKINGKTLDAKPVYRLGSSVTLKADTIGQVITIESAHQQNGFLRGGEEAMIWDVYVFGDAAAR